MLSRKYLAFLLIVTMVTSQSVYPTTAVLYSTNSVPTIQTFPATVSAVPTVISATMPATKSAIVTATAVPATSKPTCVAATMPPTTPTISLTSMPSSSKPTVSFSSTPSSVPKVIASPVTSETVPKAYFLPASIPEPKVTVLANDKPSIVGPRLYEDYVDVKPTICRDLPSKIRRDGPMTPAKRLTMACTDDAPTFLSEQPLCPGLSKMDITPPLGLKKEGSSKNPIDFEGLFDSFLTCL